jgi:type IV pilus biogenesis protein CpaD/CtpE
MAAILLLALAGCAPLASGYTDAEWPKTLVLDDATQSLALRFVPGSSRLLAPDAVYLRRLASSGEIAPSDRVLIAAGGNPALARARLAVLQRTLLSYGIAPVPASLGHMPPDQAIIDRVRYAVSLPRCPNWMKPPGADHTNTPSSNFGCATEVNLGRMIASPPDLASGRELGPATALTEVSALGRYYSDRVYLAPSASLITSLGNNSPVPPGAQGQQERSLSTLFTETTPTANPIAAAAAGGGPAGISEAVSRSGAALEGSPGPGAAPSGSSPSSGG